MKLFPSLSALLICCVTSSALAGDFYVQIDLENGNTLLAVVDLDTGEAIPVSNIESPRTLAFDFPDIGDDLIGTAGGFVYNWDFETGAATQGANVSGFNGSYPAFAFESSTSALAIDRNDNLFRIDTTNGNSTSLGNISVPDGARGMDISPDGKLYFLTGIQSNSNSRLYQVDPNNPGDRINVGNTGQALVGADVAFDCVGNLFGITDPNPADGDTALLFSIDTDDASTQDVITIWSDLGEINTANLSWGPGDGCPPEITCSLECDTLWPPNHKMKNVGFDAVIESGREIDDVTITVYSDEPEEDQTGDGNHEPDAQDIGLGTLKLRKERKGDGDGRVYLIIITATDNLGRSTTECCTVTVSKSQSKAAKASVAAQAAAAEAECQATGAAPAGFYQIGN